MNKKGVEGRILEYGLGILVLLAVIIVIFRPETLLGSTKSITEAITYYTPKGDRIEPSESELIEIIPKAFRTKEEESTKIKYFVGYKKGDNPKKKINVSIEIFNTNGDKKVIYNYKKYPGEQYINIWNGLDLNGTELPNGIYFIRITIGDYKSILEDGKIVKIG